MDSDNRKRYSMATGREQSSANTSYSAEENLGKVHPDSQENLEIQGGSELRSRSTAYSAVEKKIVDKPETVKAGQSEVKGLNPDEFMAAISTGELFMVNSRRKNGLILYKDYYAEFAGPGSAVGGLFDANCHRVIPVGDLSLLRPATYEERQKAYLIRRQWIRLTQKFTDSSVPIQRAQMILNQFENYFDADAIAELPDEAFALLVGVLPQTVQIVRQGYGNLRDRF